MQKHTHFSDLKEIIEAFRDRELHTAMDYLKAFNSHKKRKPKQLKLLELLHQNPDISYKEAKQKTYPEANKTTFDRALQRLNEKLQEVLLLDINTQKKENYSLWYRSKIKCRKLLITADTILGRGLELQALKLYQKVERIAQKHELYQELIESLEYQQILNGLLHGKPFDLQRRIKHTRTVKEKVYYALVCYYQFFGTTDFQGNINQKVGFLTEVIPELQKHFKQTNSAIIGYHLLYLMQEYYFVFKDYYQIRKTGKKIIDLVNNNPSINIKNRLAIAYSVMTKNEIHLFDFKKAEKFGTYALKLYSSESWNFFVTQKYLFFVHFYNHAFTKSNKIIETILKEKKINDFPFKKNVTLFLKANNEFALQHYKSSKQTLQQIDMIEKDTEGWNPWMRILMVQNLIELQQYDLAEFHIDNFNQFIQRNRKATDFRKRVILIREILLQLLKSNFDFSKTHSEKQKELDLLKRTDDNASWEPTSPELIIFHQWFKCKMENKNYTPHYQPYIPKPKKNREADFIPVLEE